MSMKTKINNSWTDVTELYTKISGNWKQVLAGYTKVNGTWKNIYQSKPYDARIAYLESTGTQCIDTGIILQENDVVEIDIEFSSLTDNFMLGASALSDEGSIWLEVYNAARYYVRYGSLSSASVKDNATNDVGKMRTYKLQKGSFCVDDFLKLTPALDNMPQRSLYIFGRNRSTPNFGVGKIGEMKITRNGSVIMNLIPVRVGQVGCMYDKVGKDLFYNDGTGSFTLGPDITPIEYIENTGKSYINTMYKPNLDTRIVFDMQTVTSTDYGRLVGCCGSTWNEPPLLQIDYETGATGNLNYMIGNDTGWNTVTSVTGDYNKHTYDLSTTSFLRDGIQVATHSSDTFQCTANLAIFYYLLSIAVPSSTLGYLKGRVYSFKIYENGTLVKDFIPVRAGSVGYLYDKVNDRLHGNRGADNFTIGSDI